MKFALPIGLLVATAVLMTASLVSGRSVTGVDASNSFHGIATTAHSPEQAVNDLVTNIQQHNWDVAFNSLSKSSDVTKAAFVQSWKGIDGSLRSFSVVEDFQQHALHITDNDAQIRVHVKFSTPVGPVEDVRDLHVVHEGDAWRVVWPRTEATVSTAQVVPENFLRWDVVSGNAPDQWGLNNVDSPRVRIVSMNAVDTAEGAIVMGELVNEDTIPAFVNVDATLLDASGDTVDEENSFDKVAHILLPKQVTPYRIDFPNISLKRVKSVRMDEKAALVPASADPVIGVMNQKLETDAQGKTVLAGDLMNESGILVNIPHVIASFYDNNGKIIWVSDGYVDNALPAQASEPFAVEIPHSIAANVHGYHVVVNHYIEGGTS
jgi:hypothetical protein